MFSPIIVMVGIIATFIFVGLFIDYGKRKNWDKLAKEHSK